MPGSTPPTSQLDWLISTTAMIVLSWSRATRDLLKSFGWGIGALHQLVAATMVPFPRRLPHSISLVEGAGFEPSVPLREVSVNFSLVEGAGFEPSVPLREVSVNFSLVEGAGFEPSVPLREVSVNFSLVEGAG